ncbi:Hypothetical predicted protein [Cloeon dipterum]|uniref:FLYWCH-type domain-containing protein n=1 Tax=Cloeon dipterum TaxID=197152 RepID=A0A8S1CV62_9INSE|nr:Hypothetical predicted protein [Cloeon dipterum]
MEFSPTKHGGVKLAFKGFEYSVHSVGTTFIRWRCVRRGCVAKVCRAHLRTDIDRQRVLLEPGGTKNAHNHQPSAALCPWPPTQLFAAVPRVFCQLRNRDRYEPRSCHAAASCLASGRPEHANTPVRFNRHKPSGFVRFRIRFSWRDRPIATGLTRWRLSGPVRISLFVAAMDNETKLYMKRMLLSGDAVVTQFKGGGGGSMVSDVWKKFGRIAIRATGNLVVGVVACSLCFKVYSYKDSSQGTSTLRLHVCGNDDAPVRKVRKSGGTDKPS